ncbi:MAG: 50S ribosomal protein L3 [Gammaproteobacteria bacterium]|nr:MAG: 50S ribosomal protein L3 [Gammaproteobacteria bacterium]
MKERYNMPTGIVGKKLGMTAFLTTRARPTPVTAISVEPNRITQVKSNEVDGYHAVQVTTGSSKNNAVSRPLAGHFAKANIEAGRGLWEFRLGDITDDLIVGEELTVDQFFEGQIVDVIGTSKGKGFAGAIKRWNFSHQDNTQEIQYRTVHRALSVNARRPGRVFKGKKMAGHLGSVRVTTQNLVVVRIDRDRNFMLVKGAVPGYVGGDVIVIPGVKAGSQNASAFKEAKVEAESTT